MKKYLLGAASLLLVAATAIGGYSYYQEQQVDPMIRENIEALSQKEFDYPTGQPEVSSYTCGNSGCMSTVRKCQGGGGGCNEIVCSTHK